MPFTCKVGDSFYLHDTGGRHRYVILTKPNSDNQVVLVNFTDSQNIDSPVTFSPKDDKNLFTIRTGIYYAYSQLVSVTKLKKLTITGWEFCQLNHIKRIVIGAFQSQHTPMYILKELSTQYPEEHKRYCSWDYI
jgi:hypothetical protein